MTHVDECIEYVRTCDAGECDRETLAVVLAEDGWISVCAGHAAAWIAAELEVNDSGKAS